MSVALTEIYERLARPDGGFDYAAVALSGGPHYLARGIDGGPVFLVRTLPDRSSVLPVIRTRHILARFNVECAVQGVHDHGLFTTLALRGGDHRMTDVFLRLGAAIADDLGEEPTVTVAQEAILRATELFSALGAPPRRSTLGLWGELTFVLTSGRVADLLACWRPEPEALFDFVGSMGAVEVKTTTQRRRKHQFSLDQLTNGASRPVFVVSLMTQPTQAAGGMSVLDLADRIVAEAPTSTVHVLEVIAQTLGQRWEEAATMYWDFAAAQDSAMVYRANDIPRPSIQHAAVSDVRFACDLSVSVPGSSGVSMALRAI